MTADVPFVAIGAPFRRIFAPIGFVLLIPYKECAVLHECDERSRLLRRAGTCAKTQAAAQISLTIADNQSGCRR
jgi:hypothetical protein